LRYQVVTRKPQASTQVEVIDADRIDEAYDRVVAGDVRFRFVIDISTMSEPVTTVG
jgi:uncharacterized zinc-type alcohol dehydrogenase-like protein